MPNIAPVLLPASDGAHVSENGVLILSIQGTIGDPDVPDFHLVIDPDANGVYGIAIIGEATAPVTLYYSTTGADTEAVWHQITAENLAAGALHLLADGNTYIKVVPDSEYSGTISNFVSVIAWDGTNGITNGTYAPIIATGGSTAYSIYEEHPDLIVEPVGILTNTAPILLPASDDAHVSENGVLIVSIQGIIGDPDVPDFHLVNDPDANGVYGIAITGEATAPVTVYYSTTGADTGAVWHQITAENLAAGALHLLADGNTYIKVVPDSEYSGTISNFVSVIAWDGTNGITNGTYAPIIATGGSTAYSIYEEHPDLIVEPVGILTNTAPILLPASDDAHVSENGVLIVSIQGIIGDPDVPDFHLVNDPDANGVYGIAITGEATAPVTVYYSTTGADTGAVWYQITAENLAAGALHLLADGNTYIKVVPDSEYSGTISNFVSVIAWDGTNGITNGTYAPIITTGGSTAYSIYEEHPDLIVEPVGILTNTAPKFGTGDGKVTTAIGSYDDTAYSSILQSDGKILLAGHSYNGSNNDFTVVRYNSDGSLDSTFSDDGKVMTPVNYADYAISIAVQSDGKIVAAGESDYDFAVVRYNSDGSLDTTFSSDGKVTTPILGLDDKGKDVFILPDGKIVVSGYSSNSWTGYDFTVVRYNSDGSLDTTFDGDGKVTTPIGSYDDFGYSLILQPDGKMIVAGSSSQAGYYNDGTPDDSNFNFALVRYNNDGTLDTTFSTDGKVTTDFSSGNDHGQSVALQSDGKIVVAGLAENANNYDFAIVRYNSDGTLDMTFGNDGKVTTDFGFGDDQGYGIIIQADGKIVVAGNSENGNDYDFALVRYNSDGSLDTTFGSNGTVTTDFGLGNDSAMSVMLESDGKILMAGNSFNGSNYDFAIARYNSDGSLDTTFNSVNTLDGNPTFIENGSSVILDSDVQIYDAELSVLGNYGGATLTLARDGGANSEDQFSGASIVAGQANGDVVVSAITVGTYSYLNGTLILTFNTNATQILVNQVMQNIAYSNASEAPPVNVTIDWTFSDANTGGALAAIGSTTVNITAVNDAPTFIVGDGKITTQIGTYDDGRSVILQQDGKILVAGTSDHNFALTRYNSDGSLDTTFGEDGKVTTDVSSAFDTGKSVVVQPDGKILIAGTGNYDFALVRYNSDGTLDTTFDGDGKVITPVGPYADMGESVTLQTDGKIIVAGYSYSTSGEDDFSLVRYNSDGSLDTTFGSNGKVITSSPSIDDKGESVILQSDGKILVAGSSQNGGYYDFTLARYNSDGSPDTTFDGDGKVMTDLSGSYDFAYSVAIQTDGKILVAGRSAGDSGYDLALVRYNSDGSLDTTFDGDGKVTTVTGVGNPYNITGISIQTDGKILVAGSIYNGSNDDFALIRYNSDGSLDTTFGSDGKVTTDLGSYDAGYSVALQEDGKIVVAGTSNNIFALARYNSDGSLDTTFNSVNTLNGAQDYIENGSPVILDSDVQIYDAELSALGNYGGATLIISRDGGANSDDQFYGAGIVAGQPNGNIVVLTTTVGTYSYSPGYLTITFNTNATQTLVNQTMQSIAYSNSSDTPPANVQIDWFFSDGNSGAQGAGGALMTSGITTINVTAVNDAPTSINSTVSTNENTSLNTLLPNAIDLDGDIVAYTLKSNPYHGTASVQTNGSYTYTPDSSFSGIDLFTYTVSDENGGSNSYIVKVDVLETGYVPLPSVEGVNLSNVAKLYVATFNRAPDTLGLDYWVYQSGLGIEQIAQSFFDQPETKALYPTGTSNTSFVTSVYDNLFNRAPDQAGLDYWVHELDIGSIAKQNFILAVINGAQDTEISLDITILTNKMNIGLFFAQEDLDNVDDARLVMENVSSVSSSVEDALSLIVVMDNSSSFVFTEEWLVGKTIYDVFSGDDDGIIDEMDALTFNSGGTGTITGDDESMDLTWSVDSEGILTIDSGSYETYYVSVLEESNDYNALKIVWAETYDEALNAQADSSNYEYIFLSYDDATDFIAEQIDEENTSYQELLPADMEALASLVSLNTYTGELSNASIRAQVIAHTGSDAYYAAFDPMNYEGSADGIFTPAELGLPNFENLSATVETIESLFYGTIIQACKAVDMEEAISINNFTTANQSALEAGNQTTIDAYINLMVSVFSDAASPSIFPDQTIAEMTVSAGTMFVEIVGTNSTPALFDGVLLGFMG